MGPFDPDKKSAKQSKSAKSSQEEQQRAVSLNVENRVLPYRDKEGCRFLYNSRLENTPSVNKTLTSHWTFSDSVAIFWKRTYGWSLHSVRDLAAYVCLCSHRCPDLTKDPNAPDLRERLNTMLTYGWDRFRNQVVWRLLRS